MKRLLAFLFLVSMCQADTLDVQLDHSGSYKSGYMKIRSATNWVTVAKTNIVTRTFTNFVPVGVVTAYVGALSAWVTITNGATLPSNWLTLPTPQPPPPPYEAGYYVGVNTNGVVGSDSNSGDFDHPFATIQHGVNVAQPGQKVILFNGNYAGFTAARSGQSTNRITIKAFGTNAVLNSGGVFNRRISLEPYDWISLIGLTVTGAPNVQIYLSNTSGTIISNCTVMGGNNGINGSYNDTVTVVNCSISSTTSGPCIYLSGATSGHIIRGNTVHNSFSKGIFLNGYNYGSGTEIIRDVIVENNVSYSNGNNGITFDNVQNSTIRNNITYHNCLAGGQGGIVVYSSQSSPIAKCSTNNLVVNNTSVETAAPGVTIFDYGHSNVVFNNIMVRGGGAQYSDLVGDNFTNRNVMQTSTTGLFVDAATFDYHLAVGSAAVDAGTNTYRSLSAPSVDLEGTARPQGSTHDTGAYEQ